jgi:hypothetical protein
MAYGIPHTIWTQAPRFLSVSWRGFTCSSRPTTIPTHCDGGVLVTPAMTTEWDAESRLTTVAVRGSCCFSVIGVMPCAPTKHASTRSVNADVPSPGGGASSRIRGRPCGSASRPVRRSNRRRRRGQDKAPFSSLTEKSVSTGRSLDKRCCVDHTVGYLIRYAIL